MGIILNGIWWGFLRRWFGGLFPDEKYKVLGNRGLQTTVMLLSLFPVIMYQTIYSSSSFMLWVSSFFESKYHIYYSAAVALVLTLWVQFQFWSRGHGGTFADMGRTLEPNESRYNRWFKWPLDKIYDILNYLKLNNSTVAWLLQNWTGRKYGYTYDMVYHTMRYSLCMLVPTFALQNWTWFIIGLLSAPIYEMNLRLYEKNENLFLKKIEWLDRANKLSEIEYGFIFGALILL